LSHGVMGVSDVRSQRVNVIPADQVLSHYPLITLVYLVLSGYLSQTLLSGKGQAVR